MKIILFIPTLGDIPTRMVAFLMDIETKHELKVITTSRQLISYARNLALGKLIEYDYDYLIMLDDDNIPVYNNFIDLLVGHGKDVVSGVIRLRNRQEDLNICYSENINGLIKYNHYKDILGLYKLQEIDNCGSGLVCISKKVAKEMLEKYPRPFENKYTYYIKKNNGTSMEFSPYIFGEKDFATNNDGGLIIQGRELSEDFLFFERVKDLGYKLYTDTTIKCNHLGEQIILNV